MKIVYFGILSKTIAYHKKMIEERLKMATKKKNFKNMVKSHLYQQYYENGKGHSRHQEKRDTGNFAHYDRIYSRTSLKTHLSRAEQFADWTKEHHPEIRKIDDISRGVAKEYLQHQQERGLSVRTVEADMSFLNRIKVSSGDWSRDDILTKKEAEIRPRRMSETRNNRFDKPSHINTHSDYQQKVVDFGKTFGLRKSELIHQRSNKYYAVTTNSLYEKDDKIYACVFGKGGKYRVAEALETHQDMIKAEYGEYIQKVTELPSGEQIKAEYSRDEHLFKKDISHNVRVHVECRQYYANEKLEELERNDRHFELLAKNELESGSNIYKTNGREMERDHAQFVSQQLGHNRIYELKSYINLN